MELLRKLWNRVGPFSGMTENLLVDAWRWWIKEKYHDERFIDVVAVGIAEDKSIYAKGFCPAVLLAGIKKPSVVLRSMVQSRLVAIKGPIPVLPTHQLILLPLPSFWVRGSSATIKQFLKDWEGKTEVFDLPFCFYTIMR